MQTPWGKSQYKKEYARSINFYGTASHGGFKISKKLNDTIPDYMRNDNGWYEEDCEWCKPAVCFYYAFTKDYESALETMINWYPDEFEKLFDVKLNVDQSYVLKRRHEIETSKNKYVVVSALSIDGDTVKVCAIKGGRLENGQYASNDEKWFLVPGNEYTSHHFVIDESKHIETTPGF